MEGAQIADYVAAIEVVADALYADGFPADQASRAAELAIKALRPGEPIYCPCQGQCHVTRHPCSLSCLAHAGVTP